MKTVLRVAFGLIVAWLLGFLLNVSAAMVSQTYAPYIVRWGWFIVVLCLGGYLIRLPASKAAISGSWYRTGSRGLWIAVLLVSVIAYAGVSYWAVNALWDRLSYVPKSSPNTSIDGRQEAVAPAAPKTLPTPVQHQHPVPGLPAMKPVSDSYLFIRPIGFNTSEANYVWQLDLLIHDRGAVLHNVAINITEQNRYHGKPVGEHNQFPKQVDKQVISLPELDFFNFTEFNAPIQGPAVWWQALYPDRVDWYITFTYSQKEQGYLFFEDIAERKVNGLWRESIYLYSATSHPVFACRDPELLGLSNTLMKVSNSCNFLESDIVPAQSARHTSEPPLVSDPPPTQSAPVKPANPEPSQSFRNAQEAVDRLRTALYGSDIPVDYIITFSGVDGDLAGEIKALLKLACQAPHCREYETTDPWVDLDKHLPQRGEPQIVVHSVETIKNTPQRPQDLQYHRYLSLLSGTYDALHGRGLADAKTSDIPDVIKGYLKTPNANPLWIEIGKGAQKTR